MRRTSAMLAVVLIGITTLHHSALAAPASSTQGMVASAHPAATRAGIEMLNVGGNASDAASAVAFALAVVEPYSSGIGGGGFALVRHKGAIAYLDFRERAPSKASQDMFIGKNGPDFLRARDGVLGVAVPGAVAGYLELQHRYGKLSRAQMLAPAIALAENGFVVDLRYQKYTKMRLEALAADPVARSIFLIKNAKGSFEVPGVGHRIVQKDLARTLRSIATHGRAGFYEGDVAKNMLGDIKQRGGMITQDDLNNFKVVDREPLMGSYRGHAIVTAPPPSSGGEILLTILNIMETLPENVPYRDPARIHLYIEASKRAFADRHLLGDPQYLPWLSQQIPHLISKDRAKVVAEIITNHASDALSIPPAQGAQKAHPDLVIPNYGPKKEKERTETTHLSVIDKDGNAVSMTTTLNYAWGAGFVAGNTGIVMNDEMDDFAVAPGVPNSYGIVGSLANAVAPGKTPLSSMAPTLVFQGKDTTTPLLLVIGAPGGSTIPTSVAQGIINFFDHKMDIERAIGSGRLHHQHLPDQIRVEPFALDPATADALQARGHSFDRWADIWGNAAAIAIDPVTGIRTGAADPRGVGTAMGN